MLSSTLNVYPFPSSLRVGLVTTAASHTIFQNVLPNPGHHTEIPLISHAHTSPSQTPLTPTSQSYIEIITTLDPAQDLSAHSSMPVRDVEGHTPGILALMGLTTTIT